MATTTDYERAYADLIEVFGKAMTAVLKQWDSEEAMNLTSEAFELAKRNGWAYEEDQEWYLWTLKATQPEIVANGLAHAIQKVRL